MARGAEEPFLGTNDALTLKRWRNEFRRKALDETMIAGLIGGEDAIITDVTDLQSGGDEVTYPLLANLVGPGVVGSKTLTGNEEDPSWFSDKLKIDQTRHGVFVGDKLSEQRNPGIMRNRANSLLSDWASTVIMDPSGFNHLCSYTPANTDSATVNASMRGHNDVSAASRILRPGTHTTDQAVGGDSTAKINYALIDKLIEMANTAGTGAKGRLRRPSGGRWKLFVHWSQITDLYSDETFQAQHLAAVAGADKREGLFKETKLVYRDVEIIPSNYVTKGVHSSTGAAVDNTRRAVFCGAGAMSIAFGKGYAGGAWDWQEDSRDFEQRKYVSAGLIWGCKANIFGPVGSKVDYGKIVVTTYSVAAA